MRRFLSFGRVCAAMIACVSLLAGQARAAPLWWRVGVGPGDVWVLGAPVVTPKGMPWDKSSLARRLKGARALIAPPQPKGGLAAFGALMAHAGDLRSASPMEAGLPADLRRRFAEARTRIGKSAGRYSGWKPIIAGEMLQGDTLKALNLAPGEVVAEVRRSARSVAVAEAASAKFDMAPIFAGAASAPPSVQALCLASELAQVDMAPRSSREAMAWARGEATPAAARTAVDQACLTALPALAALADRTEQEELAALLTATRRPGRTVAVIDLAGLTRPMGVLDQLRSRGVAVSQPGP